MRKYYRKDRENVDFKWLKYRKVQNPAHYRTLERDIKNEITINNQVDKQKVREHIGEVQLKIEMIEKAKERTLSIYLPLAILVPAALVGIVGGLLPEKFFASMILVLAYILFGIFMMLVSIMPNFEERRSKLLFLNMTKEILVSCL